jgi:hypothetical protein
MSFRFVSAFSQQVREKQMCFIRGKGMGLEN